MINTNAVQPNYNKNPRLKRLLRISHLPFIWLEFFWGYQSVMLIVNSFEHNEIVRLSLQRLWEFNFWLIGITVIVVGLWIWAVIRVFTKSASLETRPAKGKWEKVNDVFRTVFLWIMSPFIGFTFGILKTPDADNFSAGLPKKFLWDISLTLSNIIIPLIIINLIVTLVSLFLDEYDKWQAKRQPR